MKTKAHMICHTHWDREWYFTREQFRTKLIRLIDDILEVIDTVPEYVSFMLDGQTIVIEDYLEIKPYNREKLMKALRSGKIICGPWYILPDELLISGEAHIRNYLTGSRIIGETGIRMEAAYLPDSFGHPAQMPQIAEGLGMDTMIFWRGISNKIRNTEFYWEAPDGCSKVLCIHMPHGYGNCGNLDADMDITIPRITNLIESLKEKSTTDVILLMNGSDHITCQKNITEIVKLINEACPHYEIHLSTMNQYIKDLRSKSLKLVSYSGEFRSAERSMLLGGTLSTRMYLKQNNDVVQKVMERYIEPMLSGERILGGYEDTKGYSEYIWKKILENQPHDSICGCSTDEVHAEMAARFQCVRQVEEMILSDTVKRINALLRSEDESEVHWKDNSFAKNNIVQLMLFEPNQDRMPSYMETTVLLDKVLVQEVNFTKSTIEDYEESIIHPEIPNSIQIHDEFGREISCVILDKSKAYETLYQDHTLPEIYKVNRIKVGLLLPPFDYGLHMLYVEKSEKRIGSIELQKENASIENAFIENASIENASIENEYYRIILVNGAFEVFDKKNNKLHNGVGRFIDKGDAGDEYTYSWPLEDEVYSLKQEDITVSKELLGDLGEGLILSGNLLLPEGLEENRIRRNKNLVKSPFKMKVSLYTGINRIDFITEFENNSKDHRLQVQFPSGILTEFSESSDVFHVTKRDIEVCIPKEWAEYPQTTHPTHGFINVEDGNYGMSAATCGLTEFEAVQLKEETAVNITLLRCVGWLSRTDLLTRKGNGGWTIETPDAQCIGKHVFEYSLAYHLGGWRECGCYGLMEKRRLPGLMRQLQYSDSVITDNLLKWVSDLPKEIRLSALKVSEDGSGIIVRFYSIGVEICPVTLPIPGLVKSAVRVDLSENDLEEIPRKGNGISFVVKPSEIVTIKMK